MAVPLDLRKPTVLVTFLIAVTKCLIEGREEEVLGGGLQFEGIHFTWWRRHGIRSLGLPHLETEGRQKVELVCKTSSPPPCDPVPRTEAPHPKGPFSKQPHRLEPSINT